MYFNELAMWSEWGDGGGENQTYNNELALWCEWGGGGGENQTTGSWALMLCLRTNLAIGQSSSSCTYTLLLPKGVEIDLIFPLCAVVSDIWANFQIAIFWASNLAIDQSSRSWT